MTRGVFLATMLIWALGGPWGSGPARAQPPSRTVRLESPGFHGLLALSEVQRELQLAPDQAARAVELLENVRRLADLPDSALSDRERRLAALRREQAARLADLLSAAQMARLRELELQQAGMHALAREEVADALRLTADQRRKVEKELQEEREATHYAFWGVPSTSDLDAARQRAADLHRAAGIRLGALLTADQRRQLRALQGSPFRFPAARVPGAGGRFQEGTAMDAGRE